MSICLSPVTITTTVGATPAVEVVVYTPSSGVLPLCNNGDFVLIDPQEFVTVSANPFVIDVAGASEISVAIAGIWALAWVFRQIIKAMAIDEKETRDD